MIAKIDYKDTRTPTSTTAMSLDAASAGFKSSEHSPPIYVFRS